MNQIVRNAERRSWDPFGDFDSLVNTFFRPAYAANQERGNGLVPAVDIHEGDNAWLVTAELPGVSKDDLEITINDGVLTINAETRSDKSEEKDGRLIRQERRYGKFVRSMRLGSEIDESNVKADYVDGVLKLTLPKAEEVKPRRIEVSVN